MAKEVAIAKRAKISKANRNMLIAVCGAAMIMGCSIVGAIWCIKVIGFNGAVLTAQEKAILDYEKSIVNIGICRGQNGRIAGSLKDCDPNDISEADIPGTLRYEIMVNMANNEALESVGRDALSVCFKPDGMKIDFVGLLNEAEYEEERLAALDMIRMCSALRVVPDALPSTENVEALLASLNYILLAVGVPKGSIEGLKPGSGGDFGGGGAGLSGMPVDFSLNNDQNSVYLSLKGIELSIKTFDLRIAVIEWKADGKVEMSVKGMAYHTTEMAKPTRTEIVSASSNAEAK